MKKFTISLIAFAVISTASFASNRDVTTPYGARDTQQAGSVSTSHALAIPAKSSSMAKSSSKAGDDMGLGGSNRR